MSKSSQSLPLRLDPSKYFDRALEVLKATTIGERESWYNHPCTQAVRQLLEGSLVQIALSWLGGAYSSEESADVTAQKQAHARGQAYSVDTLLNVLEYVRKGEEEEEDGAEADGA